ncbi:MAG: hypothetical protein J5802_02425 [Butyrivibrio sp.]|nr:hypothetical protein [Butyrivibrio sp.]
MKKHLKSILFYSVVALAIYILSQCILGIFGLQFRAKINVWWLGITFGLFVIGVVQQCIIRKSKKLVFSVVIGVVSFAVLCLNPFFGIFVIDSIERIPHKEHVLVIDGYKFVGYEDDFWDVFIDFYDYKNGIVSGTKKRFTAIGYETDDAGNKVFYDDLRYYKHLDDIYEFKYGEFDTSELTVAE